MDGGVFLDGGQAAWMEGGCLAGGQALGWRGGGGLDGGCLVGGRYGAWLDGGRVAGGVFWMEGSRLDGQGGWLKGRRLDGGQSLDGGVLGWMEDAWMEGSFWMEGRRLGWRGGFDGGAWLDGGRAADGGVFLDGAYGGGRWMEGVWMELSRGGGWMEGWMERFCGSVRAVRVACRFSGSRFFAVHRAGRFLAVRFRFAVRFAAFLQILLARIGLSKHTPILFSISISRLLLRSSEGSKEGTFVSV